MWLGSLIWEPAGAWGLVVAKSKYLSLACCNSQLSPGWLMQAPPFPLASVLPTSGIGWVHLALSETAVRDAHFAVETLKLAWCSSVIWGWREDLAQALGKSHKPAPLSTSEKEGKAIPGLPADKGMDRIFVSMSLGLAW